MREEFAVHDQHDYAVEQAADADSPARWVAIFAVILAAMGALIGYQNGDNE